MARPRKTTQEAIEDRFAAMPLASQEILMDRLELIHRLTRKGLITPGKETDDGTAAVDASADRE